MIDERTLERVELFAGVNAAARRELAARAATVRFSAGEVLWTAGAEARGLYVVVAGRVRVVRSVDGRERAIHTEVAGGTLGEVPLFEGTRYPATAIAVEPTLCIHLDRAALEAAIRADPSLAFLLLRGLARRVRGLIERLERVTTRTVRSRLAALLLERHRVAAGDFSLGAPQARVAEELGTVREVLVRELGALRDAGLIRSAGRGRYRVEDEGALRALAGPRSA